jgi:hypothetical protein
MKLAKLSILLVLITIIYQKSSAQTGLIPLSQEALLQINTENKIAAQNINHSVITKYNITTSIKTISAQDSASIVKRFLEKEGVLSCYYYPSTAQLVVLSKKEINSFQIITIKQLLAEYKLYISKFEENYFKKS